MAKDVAQARRIERQRVIVVQVLGGQFAKATLAYRGGVSHAHPLHLPVVAQETVDGGQARRTTLARQEQQAGENDVGAQ